MFKYFKIAMVIMPIVCFCHNQDAGLERILTTKNPAILQVVEDRIYVNPAQVFLTNHGIFLRIHDQEFIPIASVYSDGQGCYTSLAENRICNLIPVDQFWPWHCKKCGRWTTGWLACEFCFNPR